MARKMDYSKIRRKPIDRDDEVEPKESGPGYSKRGKILIFTDGSCLKNPGGKGGWAAIIRGLGDRDIEMYGCQAESTNNEMEMMGAIMALEYLSKPASVIVFSDSQYLRQGASKWIKGWKARGWKTQEGAPVKNRGLWNRIDIQLQKHEISWHWVRGHNGHPENERCDKLAGRAAREQIAA